MIHTIRVASDSHQTVLSVIEEKSLVKERLTPTLSRALFRRPRQVTATRSSAAILANDVDAFHDRREQRLPSSAQQGVHIAAAVQPAYTRLALASPPSPPQFAAERALVFLAVAFGRLRCGRGS